MPIFLCSIPFRRGEILDPGDGVSRIEYVVSSVYGVKKIAVGNFGFFSQFMCRGKVVESRSKVAKVQRFQNRESRLPQRGCVPCKSGELAEGPAKIHP